MWQGVKNVYHFLQAIIALLVYGFPGRGIIIIGVTGTDGKTTTASLIYHILINAGKKAALISSVGAVINGKASDIGLHVTTPGRFDIQKYLRKAQKVGIKYVVLEVTSHALDQHRAYGVPFAVGVVTNVTREHLDYHKTYNNYVHVKAKLLRKAKIAVINKDDQSYLRIKKHELKGKDKRIVTYGMKKDSDLNPHNFPFRTKLLGKFNEYNCLAAIAVLRELHLADDLIRKGIVSFKAPVGRQEVIYDKDFTVINDFAHTPNSFASILPEVKKITKNRLIHVFGAAAKRDVYKRPEMGQLSAKYADIIVLTSEDPRGENIEKINNEILKGISNSKFQVLNLQKVENIKKDGKYVFKIPDRKEAINFVISIAQKGDVVLLTGKGHEKSINYGRGEQPWNETEIALQSIRSMR
ncbi:UDP-N-acetylmuramyl-tripeptide synthetase [Candidatus Roizmanbacteria bacterium]|nr:UDP-N-acetylmuramyl-tripeptide synthetase [Candidatus Roizmanbacteria bacterium]